LATPASLFVPRPETIAELILPPELSVVRGEQRSVITVAEEPERFVEEPVLAPEDIKAVELARLVPPSGNASICDQQLWLGPKAAGKKIEIWTDLVSVHISLDGHHLKTVPSRLSIASLHRLIREGATVAGPPPRGPAATGLRAADTTLEFERTVNGCGLVSIGGRQFVVGLALAGQRARIHLEGDVGHVIQNCVVVRSFPCALEPSKRQRLQGARLPEATALPSTDPFVIGRLVSSNGTIVVGGQKIHVGRAHLRKTVEVLVEERYLRITHQGTTIKVVARNTPKEVNRFKATGRAYVS
jgi:hypothetical protein